MVTLNVNFSDPATPRVLWAGLRAQDGGEARATVHRGPAEGLRGPSRAADGLQQRGVAVGARGLR